VTDCSVPASTVTTTGFPGDTPLAAADGITLSRTGTAAGVADCPPIATGPAVPGPAVPVVLALAWLDEEPPAAATTAVAPSVPRMTLRR